MVTTDFIVNKLRDRIIGQPNITQTQLAKICLKHLKVYVSASMVRKAKTKVLEDHYSQYKVEYISLQDYTEELKLNNPEFTGDYKDTNVNGVLRFFKLYICFTACKNVGQMQANNRYNDCFLKQMHKGQLLYAVGKNKNNQIFPIDQAVVQYKTGSHWTWFLEHLQLNLQINCKGAKLTIVIDMKKVFFIALNL